VQGVDGTAAWASTGRAHDTHGAVMRPDGFTASDHADPDDVGHGSALCHARWKEVEGSGAVEKLIENVVWWCSARR
jgi:hypothetical protein